MTIEQAINRVNLGNCMLFTGSGLSRGAKGSDPNKELQTAWDLAQKMYVECTGAEDEQGDLEDASKLYMETKGDHALIQFSFYERFFKDLKDEEKRELVRACDEMYRRAKWNIESDDAGISRKEDVRKTLNEMLMITSENKQYLK